MIERRGAEQADTAVGSAYGGREQEYVREAFASNWLSTLAGQETLHENAGRSMVLVCAALVGSFAADSKYMRCQSVRSDSICCRANFRQPKKATVD